GFLQLLRDFRVPLKSLDGRLDRFDGRGGHIPMRHDTDVVGQRRWASVDLARQGMAIPVKNPAHETGGIHRMRAPDAGGGDHAPQLRNSSARPWRTKIPSNRARQKSGADVVFLGTTRKSGFSCFPAISGTSSLDGYA